MKLTTGLPSHQRDAAAALYWDAFGGKLGHVLGPPPRALAFIANAIDTTHVICATADDGTLLGVAGFKTHRGALVAGSLPLMAQTYGWPGALARSALLSLLSRDSENTCFVTDGIAVAPHARNLRIGTALIDALSAEARARHYPALRLDVVDTNPRAQALYIRLGFTPTKTTFIGPLRHIFGFRYTITLTRPV